MSSFRNPSHWPAYNRKQQGRPIRPLCRELLAWAGAGDWRRAVDLGAGAGIETAALAEAGWRVLAVDAAEGTEDVIRRAVGAGEVDVWETAFEDIGALPSTALVYAGFSLPFAAPHVFQQLWACVEDALEPGGWFAANFFGPKDSWADRADMTFVDRPRLDSMLEGFELCSITEEDAPGKAYSGPKHWHVFNVLARRQG